MKQVYITPEEYGLAKENGVSYNRLTSRVRTLGWDKQKAITTPVRNTKVTSWVLIARENGIPDKRYHHRVSVHGWSEDRAATEPLCSKREKVKRLLSGLEKWLKDEELESDQQC